MAKEKKNFDYKEDLKKYLTETFQITPARVNGNSAKEQRALNRAVKLARYLALVPYTDQHR